MQARAIPLVSSDLCGGRLRSRKDWPARRRHASPSPISTGTAAASGSSRIRARPFCSTCRGRSIWSTATVSNSTDGGYLRVVPPPSRSSRSTADRPAGLAAHRLAPRQPASAAAGRRRAAAHPRRSRDRRDGGGAGRPGHPAARRPSTRRSAPMPARRTIMWIHRRETTALPPVWRTSQTGVAGAIASPPSRYRFARARYRGCRRRAICPRVEWRLHLALSLNGPLACQSATDALGWRVLQKHTAGLTAVQVRATAISTGETRRRFARASSGAADGTGQSRIEGQQFWFWPAADLTMSAMPATVPCGESNGAGGRCATTRCARRRAVIDKAPRSA